MYNIVIAESKLKDEEDKEDEEMFVLVGCKKCIYTLGLGDSSDSAIIVVIRVTTMIAIAKNYYHDSGHVVIL